MLRAWGMIVVLIACVMAAAACASSNPTTTTSTTTANAAPTSLATTSSTTTSTALETTTTSESTTTTVGATNAVEVIATLPSDPEGWKRFRVGHISLALPPTFVGGAFDGPEVKALVEHGLVTEKWLDGWRDISGEYADWLVVMIAPGLAKATPCVLVARSHLDANQDFLSYVSGLVDADWPSAAIIDVQEPARGQKLLKVTMPMPAYGETATRQTLYVDVYGDVYHVYYLAESEEAWRTVRPIFARSIAGVVVEQR